MSGGPILLTGASGLLGTWLRRSSPADREVIGLVNRRAVVDLRTVKADLRDAGAIEAAVRKVQPSMVLHAAYAKDRQSIVDATRHVGQAAAAIDADVLFVSTDAVFSGDGTPRAEDSAPDPIWEYGRWKAQAERALVDVKSASTVVRLPLVVSVDPDDHVVERIRSASLRGETTTWYSDEMRQPALASELAEAIWQIASLDPKHRGGVWHLPGPERLSRAQIADRIVATLGLDPAAVTSELTPSGAHRPRDLRLLDARATVHIDWSPQTVLV